MWGWVGPGSSRLEFKRIAAASEAFGSETMTGRADRIAAGVACDRGKRDTGSFRERENLYGDVFAGKYEGYATGYLYAARA